LAAVLPRMLGFQNEITVSVQNVMKKHGNYKYPGPGRWRRTRFSVPLRRSQSPGDARSYIRPLRGKSRGFQADGLDERSRSFDDRR